MEDDPTWDPWRGRVPETLLGERVRALRSARGWSQEQLAQEMSRTGFGWRQTTAAKTEAGDRPVRVNEAAALARVLGVPIEDLVKPDIHPLLARAHQAGAALDRARQAVDEIDTERRRRTWLAEVNRARLAAFRALADYVEAPSRETLDAAVRLVMPRFAGDDEWIELLVEAGIDRAAIEDAFASYRADHDLDTPESVPRSAVALDGDELDHYRDPAEDDALAQQAREVAERLAALLFGQRERDQQVGGREEAQSDGQHREAP